MPSLSEQVGQEVMYKANIALTTPNTSYMRENEKVLSGIGYFKDLYNPKPIVEDHNNRINEYFKKEDFKRNDLGYTIAQHILYRAAQNPSKN